MFSLPDAAATEAWGLALGRVLPSGAFVALEGDLGAGKSSLARAICRGLGVEGPIPSPTYALAHRYDGARIAVVHADWYRLRSADELEQIGWEELIDGAAALVEWADRFPEAWPVDHLRIGLAEAPVGRLVTIEAVGPAYAALVDVRG
jgi:tRNA threonylcarbamoyl adenosine modification protein YjeE